MTDNLIVLTPTQADVLRDAQTPFPSEFGDFTSTGISGKDAPAQDPKATVCKRTNL